MANLERSPRKRTLNPKLSSTDNVSQDAANLKRQKIQKGALTATTTSKKHQVSIEDSDEEDDNVPKQSSFGSKKNLRAEGDSDHDGSDDDVVKLDGEASMPASSVISEVEDGDVIEEDRDSHEAELGIFVCFSSAYT
jgi:hypothetical protein